MIDKINSRKERMLKCTLKYADLGWCVIPLWSVGEDGKCLCGKENCGSPGKHPYGKLVPNGLKDSTTDKSVIASWFKKNEELNIAICTGPQSGIVVLDVDPDGGGEDSLAKIIAEHGELPQTPKADTGGGGCHYIFKYPDGEVRNSASKIADGLDIRGKGGYIVAPPSLHASGNEYRWAVGPGVGLAECPDWLKNGSIRKEKSSQIAMNESLSKGKRNDALFSVAVSMRRKGLSADEMLPTLLEINEKRCNPPLDTVEVTKIAESAAKYEPGGNNQNAQQSSEPLTIESQLDGLDLALYFTANETASIKTKGTLIAKRNGDTVMVDTLDLAKESSRAQFIKKTTKKYPEADIEEIKEQLEKHIIAIAFELIQQSKVVVEASTRGKDEVDPLDTTPQEVIDAAFEVLTSKNLFELISTDIEALGIAGEEQLVQTLYIIMTSRLLEKPLSAIVQGASSSGKSYIIETVAKLIPPEFAVLAHDFTEQSFYYMEKGSLMHKVVVAGERLHDSNGRDGQAKDSSKAFREMVGSGVLRKAVTIKGTDGKHQTELIEQPGPIAYVESTTATAIHDEDSTRLLQLATDESSGQTQVILEAMKKEAKGQTADEMQKKEIIQRHHTMQRVLRPLKVRIPFIDRISLPEGSIATRRAFRQVISMIESVALLRQYQKTKENSGGFEYIDADQEDYRIAYRLINSVMSRMYAPLGQKSIELLNVVMEETKNEEADADYKYQCFTNQDCQRWIGVSEATIKRRLSPLAWEGIVTVDKDNKPYRYRVEKPELVKSVDVGLPHPDELAEKTEIEPF